VIHHLFPLRFFFETRNSWRPGITGGLLSRSLNAPPILRFECASLTL
jgi:hypothetical protein